MSKRRSVCQPLKLTLLSLYSRINEPALIATALLSVGVLIPGAILLGRGAAIAQVTSAPPGTISNQATGSFFDPVDASTQLVESNVVSVTVNEVAGITVASNGFSEPIDNTVNEGDTVFVDFVIANVGNDPTQFFIPGVTTISGGTANGGIQVIEYDPDGTGASPVDLSGNNITVPAAGETTGNLTGIPNNGAIPPGGTVTVRVPVTAGTAGLDLEVTLGDTTVTNGQNEAYVVGSNDVYTVDNLNTDNGDTAGAPANGEREAENSLTVTIASTTPTSLDYGDAPDSYGTNATNNSGEGIGASHGIVSNLYLGLPPDAETDAVTPLDGSGDGTDEDGITVRAMTEGASSFLVSKDEISVTNDTGSDAILHGWIDFNKDGVFSSTEHDSIVVPDDSIGVTPSTDLIWNGITVGASGSTYARFRLTTDSSITDSTPGGTANDGEVEDYEVEIAPAPPTQSGGACSIPYSMVYSGHFPNRIDAIHVDSGAFVALTTAPSAGVTNSLASDHINNLVYYAENNTLYAWSPITNTHTTITSNFSSFISGTVDLSSGGAAFYNGSLYLGVDPGNDSNTSNSEIYRVDFTPSSNGSTIQSVTSLNLSGVMPSNNWGDLTIDNNGLLLASGGGGVFWTYDLNNGTFTTLSSTVPGSSHQFAKDGQGRLWALVYEPTKFVVQVEIVGSTIQPVGATISVDPHDTSDGSECVIGESSIGDRIWADADGDGVQDPGENGIENVTVDLYWDIDGDGQIDPGDDPVLATQTTGASGNYDFFDLIFGDYIVKVTDTNSVLTDYILTTSDSEYSVTLPAGSVDFNDADFGYQPPAIATDPNILLVKRITAINRGAADEQLFDNSYVNVGTADDADNESKWPGGTSLAANGGTVASYITGITNGTDSSITIRPGDEIEYTIPFLSAGDVAAQDVLICDPIPANTTFVPDAFNNATPAFTGGGSRGILLSFNNETLALTNANDGDESTGTGPDDGFGGYYFPPGEDPSVTFPGLDCANPNDTGAVVVDLSDVPASTGDGTPDNSYGFIRFKVVVD